MYTYWKTIVGYAAHARFMAELSAKHVGFIPSPREIKTPYSYSPSTIVYTHKKTGALVFIKETGHRRYSVFKTTAPLMSDDQATKIYCAKAV